MKPQAFRTLVVLLVLFVPIPAYARDPGDANRKVPHAGDEHSTKGEKLKRKRPLTRQQKKMKACSKQAWGEHLEGSERKEFMKRCLRKGSDMENF